MPLGLRVVPELYQRGPAAGGGRVGRWATLSALACLAGGRGRPGAGPAVATWADAGAASAPTLQPCGNKRAAWAAAGGRPCGNSGTTNKEPAGPALAGI